MYLTSIAVTAATAVRKKIDKNRWRVTRVRSEFRCVDRNHSRLSARLLSTALRQVLATLSHSFSNGKLWSTRHLHQRKMKSIKAVIMKSRSYRMLRNWNEKFIIQEISVCVDAPWKPWAQKCAKVVRKPPHVPGKAETYQPTEIVVPENQAVNLRSTLRYLERHFKMRIPKFWNP